MIADEKIFIKYNCPYCRNQNNKHIKLFNKKELLEIYKNNLICYINYYKKNKEYHTNLNILKNYNNTLQNELERKNEEINRLSETLKDVINTNRNNSVNYERLLNLYKDCLVQNGYNKKILSIINKIKMCWYTTICYFGTKIKNNDISCIVTNKEWKKFVKNNIATRFNSFSVSNKTGYWNGDKEKTHTLTLIHKEDPKIMDNLINLAKEYSLIYKQDEIIINTTKSENFIEISKL
jgi:hypothetical protein